VREDGLVAFAVFGCVVAVDVGWQRHVADLLEDGAEVFCRSEAEGSLAVLSGFDDFGFEQRGLIVGGGEVETFAGLYLFAGAYECSPLLRAQLLGEEDFDAARWVGRAGLRVRASGARVA
jgi:hypothetical protein